ncbi:hypothetical protein VSH64_29585 [Amycolatopsis rhabdoformis]|uniref:Uncharacterized protein n=1 Tax=Amycolatopsis rhabdoformis TaxID=1448059 RepID=A0ABZ1HY02_9PSEU|nr:hypothetical protein [Amycolatopsis rhabdoformis]WSE27012.1 hypothetical protein VSH64_29585 [Amycolatopsis rhabdoformis]
MVAELEAALAEHLATPFPSPAVVRGRDYGSVCAVMIGADICGLSSRVAGGELLTDARWNYLAECEARLQDSLMEFPEAGRPYYAHLLRVAELAFQRMEQMAAQPSR